MPAAPGSSPTDPGSSPAPADLASLAERLAVEAAELLRAAWEERGPGGGADREGLPVGTKSSATDHVTEWDRAAERTIRAGLARVRPWDGVLGEEGGASEGSTPVTWIVDPLDGTTNFLYGLAPFAVSIAAAIDGEVVAAAVADVPHREVFVAELGGGARCNGAPVVVSDCRHLRLALLGTGFSYDADRRRRQGGVMASVLPEVRDLRRSGAAAVDLCWVACGRLDAFFERGLELWDLAAGALVAREAGATVCGLDGGPASGDGVVAAAPTIAEPLRVLLASAGASQA